MPYIDRVYGADLLRASNEISTSLKKKKRKTNYSLKVSCLRYFPHMTESQQFITHS